MIALKPLSPEGIPAALERAHRYRLLNDPADAESICRDVLAVEPEHQEAVVTLLLALSDQLVDRLTVAYPEAISLLPRIRDPYKRTYYDGILCERRAKSHLARGGPGAGAIAYDWLRQALERFEEAAAQRPANNDEALLRYNTCVRLIEGNRELEPEHHDAGPTMLE